MINRVTLVAGLGERHEGKQEHYHKGEKDVGKYVRTIVKVLLPDGDRVKANAIERLAAFPYAFTTLRPKT